MKLLIEYENSAKKVTFEDCKNLEGLLNTISSIFSLDVDSIKLQVFDKDFDAFCDIESIEDVTDFSRIKIIDRFVPKEKTEPEETISSSPSNDNLNNLRKKTWNVTSFNITADSFSLLSKEELSEAKELHDVNTKLHKASYRLRREIMDILSKELCCYSLYPTEDMYRDISQVLITTYPFLRDAFGDGTACWKIALRYRLQEMRRKTKATEAKVNSGRPSRKATGPLQPKSTLASKDVKKARKGEVNYAPEFPDGETLDTLLAHKQQLLEESRKREPNKSILSQKMANTFALRRQEILTSPMTLENFKNEWPVLFSPEMLRQEMIRLVGFDIEPRFKANLHNEGLLEIVQKKMATKVMSDEAILKCVSKIFKEKWSFFVELAGPDDLTCSLFTEDVEVEEVILPPYPVMVEVSSSWTIMAENIVLLKDLNFVTAVLCLLSVYYVCDFNYADRGQKCMLFLQVALAGIPSSKKLPVKVLKILSQMKLREQNVVTTV